MILYRKPKKSGDGWTVRTVVSKERSADGRTTYAYMDGTGELPDSAFHALLKSDSTRQIKHDGWERWAKDAEVIEIADEVSDSPESEEAEPALPVEVEDEKDHADGGTAPIDFNGSGTPTAPVAPFLPAVTNIVHAVEGRREVSGTVLQVGEDTCLVAVKSFRISGAPFAVAPGMQVEVKTSSVVVAFADRNN